MSAVIPMRNQVIIWSLVAASAGLFILCDGLSAHWGKTANTTSIVLAISLSPLSYLFFAALNQRADLAVAGALVNTVVVLGAIVVGILVFGEQPSRTQIVGIGMAIGAVTLLNVG